MFIALKKEVRVFSENKHIIVKNDVSGSFRMLSQRAALLLFLLKGIRKYEEIENEYLFLMDNKKTDMVAILKELESYIVLGNDISDAGINDLIISDVVCCKGLDEIPRLECPTNVFLKATNSCDKKCKYCSENQEINIERKCDFPVELIEKIFCKMDTKCFFELTGGEPLLHTRLIELTKRINDFGVPISLITKATNDYSFFQNVLERGKIKRICFSLDSFREEYVDNITGRDGVFNNIVECIKIAKARGLIIDINVVLTTLNDNEIEKMVIFCIDNGVDNVHFTTVWPAPNMDRDLIISPSRSKMIYSVVTRLREKYKSTIMIELTTTRCENRCVKCGKALTDVKINCNGDVFLCNGKLIGNLNSACLFDIWNSERATTARHELMGQMAT